MNEWMNLKFDEGQDLYVVSKYLPTKGGKSNFMVEKPGKHHMYRVVKVNISYWNHAWPGMVLWDEHSITSMILEPEFNHEETSAKLKLREIL